LIRGEGLFSFGCTRFGIPKHKKTDVEKQADPCYSGLMANKIQFSIGHAGFWGYSSTFDILEALVKSNECSDIFSYPGGPLEPIKVLLIHPGDIRHVITTLSKRKRHHGSNRSRLEPLRPIHFYLLESPVQVLSRNLLLLEIISDFEVPIRQRAAVFLEVFGNCLVQDRTSRYIEQLGNDLRHFMAKGSGRLEGLIDFSLLRYRERDELEAAFKNYSRSFAFAMESLREHRLRGYYADRYDTRKNVADWDYHQAIKPLASIIHIKQFKEWRVGSVGASSSSAVGTGGIAFELGDQVYTEPNRTLASYAEGTIKAGKERGARTEVLGFWGDITAGPYFSFGVDCDTPNAQAEGLFEILNKGHGTEQHRHHSVEVAMYTMFSLLWELETGSVYKMKKKNDIYSGLGVEAGLASDLATQAKAEAETSAQLENLGLEDDKNKADDEKLPAPPPETIPSISELPPTPPSSTSTTSGTATATATPTPTPTATATAEEEEELVRALARAECIVETLQGFSVLPMLGLPAAVLDKPKWAGHFDLVFVSARAASCVEPDWFARLVKPATGVLAVESGKFIVPLSKEQRAEFTSKENGYATAHGFRRMDKAPVSRRRRDENDTEDDVLFFRAPAAPAAHAPSS